MVPRAGLEPAQPYSRGILNPLCLPISPPGLKSGGASRSRTEVNGFAIRCMATLPTRLFWSGKRDSNSRPRPWQGRALPTELFPPFSNLLIYLTCFVNLMCRSMRCILLISRNESTQLLLKPDYSMLFAPPRSTFTQIIPCGAQILKH